MNRYWAPVYIWIFMHVKGLGSGIHTYGPLSAKGFLIPKYSMSTRTSKLCFTFLESTGWYLLCQIWIASVHYLVAKLEMAAVSLPWNSQAYMKGVSQNHTPLFHDLATTSLRWLWNVLLISTSSVNKYLCGVEARVHIHLSVLWSACISAWLPSHFRAFNFH